MNAIKIFASTAFTLAASVLYAADSAPKVANPDMGKAEFMDRCAACHGRQADGRGAVVDYLKHIPADLTALSKNNKGVFPAEQVYSVIDGRKLVKAHGERDMPVWGSRYSAENTRAAEYYPDTPYDMEMYTRARISALVDYIHRMQAK